MQHPSDDMMKLYTLARSYEDQGDAYHAVKLYKKAIKLMPDWSPPYARLGEFYKKRQEWKPAFHYNKKTIALDPTNKEAWWSMGIAATAMKKPRIAQRVWKKFGLQDKKWKLSCLRLNYDQSFEILLMQPVSPASGIILNIPHPKSDRRYKDIVLYDRKIAGYTVSNNKKIPIYDELGLLKRSTFFTYSCVLPEASETDIQKLSDLCQDYGLGFEVWSNSSRAMTLQPSDKPVEYYDNSIFPKASMGAFVALASRTEKAVIRVLETWQIITLQTYEELEVYH